MSFVDAQQSSKGAEVVSSYVIGGDRRSFLRLEDSDQQIFDTRFQIGLELRLRDEGRRIQVTAPPILVFEPLESVSICERLVGHRYVGRELQPFYRRSRGGRLHGQVMRLGQS